MKYFFAGALLPLFLVSCDLTKDPDVDGTAVEKMAGEFYVQFFLDGEEFDATYYHLYVYNTSANESDKLWIDAGEAWPFKIKANCNLADLSFPFTPQTYNPLFFDATGVEDSTTILDGKILLGAATTPAGNTSDSIYINFESTGIEAFELPRGTYTMAGFRITGFLEDVQ